MAVSDDDDLPIATTIPPPLPAESAEAVKPIRTARPVEAKPRRREAPPAESKSPRNRTFMACGVLGCLGICMLAAVGFVAFAAVMLVGHLGNEIAEKPSTNPNTTKGVRIERPGPILPTKLAKDTASLDIKGGTVSAVGRGANGRFLLMKVGNQIQVFDPNEGRFLAPFQFDANEQNLIFAAGATKLFVYRQGRLERYNLLTREAAEHTVVLQPPPDALACGAGSDERLYTFRSQKTGNTTTTSISVLNPETLVDSLGLPPFVVQQPLMGRVGPRLSSDGQVIGLGPDALNRGQIATFTANRLQSKHLGGDLPGHITPSPNGEFLYTTRGVFNADGTQHLKPVSRYLYTFPAAHGNDFFVSLEEGEGPNGTLLRRVKLHRTGSTDADAFVEFERVFGPTGLSPDDPLGVLTAEQRIHFWPASGLVAVIPIPSNQGVQPPLQLYKVDVAAQLEKIQAQYLAIGSDPPLFAVRGENWTYPLTAWSSAGTAKFKLKSGPAGLEVKRTTTWEVSWVVPADFTASEQNVVIEADNGEGLKAEQKFRLLIVDADR